MQSRIRLVCETWEPVGEWATLNFNYATAMRLIEPIRIVPLYQVYLGKEDDYWGGLVGAFDQELAPDFVNVVIGRTGYQYGRIARARDFSERGGDDIVATPAALLEYFWTAKHRNVAIVQFQKPCGERELQRLFAYDIVVATDSLTQTHLAQLGIHSQVVKPEEIDQLKGLLGCPNEPTPNS